MQKRLITEQLARRVVRPRARDTYKGSFGHVLVVGGNDQYGGAGIMSAGAAVHAGAGLVTLATRPVNFTALHTRYPEVMAIDYTDHKMLAELITGATVVVIGPGLGTDQESAETLEFTLTHVTDQQTVVIDGSALTLLAAEKKIEWPASHIILTPHEMEFARLSKLKIAAQTPEAIQSYMNTLPTGTILVHKRARTTLYTPGSQDYWQNTTGNPGQATGGTGDTLTGIIAAFAAQFGWSEEAIAAAVFTHSAVADQLAETEYVTLPTMVIDHVSVYMRRLSQS
ncbi:NAD(P)H-hydrate dehydratase [Schleiferilactobacillus harbinensis]|uniref:NAD(P)H-hydrate dehydratase n=1 Tax=Schleiferilactobacillus harbinensis TaxID=304207 RepID=UPI00116CBFEF|nr:NAD(P)H-hydrate dehydratase [Schleiferilactobacillus harbinensis]GEK07717.1 ADP-dependent (S)-NAD(P)H-hydrate dehydratase [Schleiferilactobacillus harbinensis]